MALATGPLNVDACLPTAAVNIKEAVFGRGSQAIARQRARQRERLLEGYGGTQFWCDIVEVTFPHFLGELDEALTGDDLNIVAVTADDLRAANESIELAATAKIVFIPTPDD